MNEVTRILNSMTRGDQEEAEALLPVVYEELRKLAAQKMSRESQGHTLQPTALVHEAWIRLVGGGNSGWDNRNHFFSAAAEAMRRILVEHARRKSSAKRGSNMVYEALDEDSGFLLAVPPEEILAVNEALEKLAAQDAQVAELVKLRYFVGMTMDETAAAMGISKRTAEALWTYGKTWLRHEIKMAIG